ncbi:MAG: hypothetical protein DRQ40_03220 [Gammaproteobacteria bacterium]|nr:MAG: hypothetical protein DRQ40_03220 [Gammaproteobacteria bacterium]
MSPEQILFFKLIEQSSVSRFILRHFDLEKRNCLLEEAERSFEVASSGEVDMLKFFINVWFNKDYYKFDLIHATGQLGQQDLNIILSWIKSPIYP